jgi:ATP-dependent Clp protease ATP-binding subunit ClpA
MRYSGACLRALDAANRDARRLRQSAVGTGHLLLSLLRDGTCAATALLRDMGPDPSQLCQLLEAQRAQVMGKEMDRTTPTPVGSPVHEGGIAEATCVGNVVHPPQEPNLLPLTAALRQAMELALEEARKMGPSQESLADGSGAADIGTEHVLLGLLLQAEQSLAGLLFQEVGAPE